MSQKASKPGEQEFKILGKSVVVDFNDRVLTRDILDLFKRIDALKTEESTPQASVYSQATLTLDLIDEADEIVTRAVGQKVRDTLWEGNPIMEPFQAFMALVGPAGRAYDAMFAEYAKPE